MWPPPTFQSKITTNKEILRIQMNLNFYEN